VPVSGSEGVPDRDCRPLGAASCARSAFVVYALTGIHQTNGGLTVRRITIATVVAMLAGVLSAAPALAQDIPSGVAFEGYSAPFNAPCPVGADGTGSISDTANDGWCDLMVRGTVTQAQITPQGIANTYSRGDFTWVEINVSLASGASGPIEVTNGQSTYYLTVTQSGARRTIRQERPSGTPACSSAAAGGWSTAARRPRPAARRSADATLARGVR